MQKPRAARMSRLAGTDDGEVDGNQGQDTRGEIQADPAQHDEQQRGNHAKAFVFGQRIVIQRCLAGLGLLEGSLVRVSRGAGAVELPIVSDPGLPQGTLRIPAAWDETLALGGLFGTVQLERSA